MKKCFKTLLLLFIFLTGHTAFAAYWDNDLKALFVNNQAVIYAINLRTFGAIDNDGDGIINEQKGDVAGTFLNVSNRLKELQLLGINTIHVLPVLKTGKVKALGTAGSLYAPISFSELNPQLKDKKSKLTLEQQAKYFINECHKRKIHVIFDMPSCASYELYVRRPSLFKKDKDGNPIVPADWTDVRLLDSSNPEVFAMYQEFVDLMISLGVDGIRADVATMKSVDFWKKLISYSQNRAPNMFWLAEAYEYDRESPSAYADFTPYDKLLELGFDAYYGPWNHLKDWKKGKELIGHVNSNISTLKGYSSPKSVIGAFATHDDLSPILTNGVRYSQMITWLNSTLPLNPYYVDGFPTGDDYVYFWANKKAPLTYTDDDYYFVHRGKLDIFNFSRAPRGKNFQLLQDYILASKFRNGALDLVAKGSFVPLYTTNPSTFAYARSIFNKSVVVIGNLDFKNDVKTVVRIPRLNDKVISIPLKIESIPQVRRGKFVTPLKAGEIMIIFFNDFSIK